MKRLALLLCSLAVAAAAPGERGTVKRVYLLRMTNGFEQFLAQQLTREGMVEVVTDPARADAVFSDVIGERLEAQLRQLEEAEGEAGAEGKTEKEEAAAGEAGSGARRRQAGGTPSGESGVPGTFGGGGKGNVFLTDRRTKTVIWSTYIRPKDMRADSLNRAAHEVAKRFGRWWGGK